MKADKKENNRRFDYWRLAVGIYGILLATLSFIRIFDNNFWGDEAYTIRLSKMSFIQMLQETAADVHPPLYYAIVQVMCRIFGCTGVVYHLVSFIPYGIILVTTMTVIWKRFGGQASVLLITLCSVLETAVNYNVEVRMYSWGALFLLLSFLALYDILTENKKHSYILFVLFSLAGAYTHYYCLISVAFLYIVLLIWAVVMRKDFLKNTLITSLVTVVLYMPWFVVLLTTFKRTVGDFWMTEIPYIKDCFAFLFQGKLEFVFFALMLLMVAIAIWYQKKEPAKITWVLAGLSSVFGTMLVGNLVSKLVRPVFIVRYLYPVAIIAWLLLAVGIASCKKKNIYLVVVTILLLVTGIPKYCEIYQQEKGQDELLTETLAASEEAVGVGNVILTDSQTIEWTVADYYYPGAECIYVDAENIPVLSGDMEYWYMTETEIGQRLGEALSEQGYTWEIVIKQGTLGTNPVTIYHFVQLQ